MIWFIIGVLGTFILLGGIKLYAICKESDIDMMPLQCYRNDGILRYNTISSIDCLGDIHYNQQLLELELEKQRLKARIIAEDISGNKSIPTNCKNCGAPLESHRCEYCGTKY